MNETRDVLEGLEGYRPGPWRAIRRPVNGNEDYFEIAWSDDGELVADGVYGENVPLIARAPELVAEVRRLRGELERVTSERDFLSRDQGPMESRMAAAVAKARAAERVATQVVADLSLPPHTRLSPGWQHDISAMANGQWAALTPEDS